MYVRVRAASWPDAPAAPAAPLLGTLLDEVFERDLHLDAVVGTAQHRGLPQHVLPHDLAVAFEGRDARADPRQVAAQLEVGIVLVAQAALEAAAHAREL